MAKFAAVAKAAPAVDLLPSDAPEASPVALAFSNAEDVTSESNSEDTGPISVPASAAPAPKAPVVVVKAPVVVVVAKPKRVLSNSDKATKEFYSTVKALGTVVGQAGVSLVALAMETAKAATENLIGEDDAQPIIEMFQTAKRAKMGMAAADEVSKSITQQASKLRQIIKLGLVAKKLLDNVSGDALSTKDAEHYAVSLLEKAQKRHVELMGDESTRKSLKDKTTYGTLVNIARAQLDDAAKGIALTEAQIDGVIIDRTEKEDKTGIDFIKTALTNAIKARDGKEQKDLPAGGFAEGRAPVENENLSYAIAALDCALRELDPKYDAEQAELEKREAAKKLLAETAAQFGMKVSFKKSK